MTAEQLRNSILQEAISGRLVPQDPNDEPASVVSHVSEDEVPFELPATWKWVQMQDVLEFVNGRAYKKEELLSQGKYRVLRVGNFFTNQNWYYSDLELPEDKYCYKGDLLYAWSASFGPRIWEGDKTIFHYHIWNVKYDKDILFREYLYYFFLYDKSQVKKSTTGSTMIHVSMENMKPRLLPLPPLAEQKRIVAKLEELLPIVEQYGKAQKELDELNAALPARLRNSILQVAMQGKLTEHDLEDNWAKVYCEKLLKLKYKSSPEWPQEYPFELPENWEWCRIGDICELMNGYAFKSTQYKETGVRVIRITNVQDGYIVDNNPKFYPQIPDIERYALKEGDLLMSLTGNVGRVGILPKSMLPAALNQRVACLRLKDERLKPFLFWYLRCPIFRERCEDSGHGMAQLNISTEWVKQEYIPLPPLAEQKRIVEKIEELFAEIDKMK